MKKMIINDCEDLAILLLNEKATTTAVVDGDHVMGLLFNLCDNAVLDGKDFEVSFVDFDKDEYDREYAVIVDYTDETFVVAIEKAYCEDRDIYLAGPDGKVYLQDTVPAKYIKDVTENPYGGEYEFLIFAFDDEELPDDCDGDCDECFLREECMGDIRIDDDCHGDCAECPYYDMDDDDDNLEVSTETKSVSVIKDKSGKITGFYVSKMDKDGITESFSINSNDMETIKQAAERYGIDLAKY